MTLMLENVPHGAENLNYLNCKKALVDEEKLSILVDMQKNATTAIAVLTERVLALRE